MNNFTFYSPTEFVFGRATETQTGTLVKKYHGTKALIVYGGGSVVRSGLLDKVKRSLDEAKVAYVELGGIQPNPTDPKVYEGIELGRNEQVDFILPVGGGSVIDTAKAIAIGIPYKGDFWDFFIGKSVPQAGLPIGVVLTIPAAGSEGSGNAVITKLDGLRKLGLHTPAILRPAFAVMNPELTFTLPPYQTACGSMDIMAHAMERYFSRTPNVEMTDRVTEGILATMIHNLPIVLERPQDYAARAEIMLCGTWAQNDMTGCGRQQDWFNHGLEHQISGYYDIAHGAGLAISFPAWMEYLCDKEECVPKLAQYAVRVWNVPMNFENQQETAREGVKRLRALIREAGLPLSLHEAGIGTEKFEEIADNMTDGGSHTCGAFYEMGREDILKLLEKMA